ncbi:MAG TPA: hypothetical protein ENI87_03410 [bacterium]|nr:hypothetical protein [bacterium]
MAAPSSMPTLAFGGSHAPAIATLVTPADEHGPREELAIPADLAAEPHGLFAPGGGNGGLLLLVLPAGRADPGAVAAARARADEERRTAPHAAAPPPPWQVALTAVGEANRRPALLALLGPLQRPRAVDLVLAADERQLIAMTDALAGIDPTADDVGFRVERACWRTWLHRIERGELTPAMRAAATRQLGAVADDPATLALLLQTSADGTTFARHLRDENLLALDDRSAALRTTARDWLAACGVAVPDYDPLADRAARRRALRAFRQTTEAPR